MRLQKLKQHLAEYANQTLTVNEIKNLGILHNTNYRMTKVLATKLNITVK